MYNVKVENKKQIIKKSRIYKIRTFQFQVNRTILPRDNARD